MMQIERFMFTRVKKMAKYAKKGALKVMKHDESFNKYKQMRDKK